VCLCACVYRKWRLQSHPVARHTRQMREELSTQPRLVGHLGGENERSGRREGRRGEEEEEEEEQEEEI